MIRRLTLAFPPSANDYWRHNRGITHRSQQAKNYIAYVDLVCRNLGMAPVDGEVSLRLQFFRPARRMDLDNMLKVLLDALQGFGYHNDSQVVEIHAQRFEDKQNPRVELEIISL